VASSKAKEGRASAPLAGYAAPAPVRRPGRLAIFAHRFLPPPLFEPALEAEFREDDALSDARRLGRVGKRDREQQLVSLVLKLDE
jgi:hypothetical protein